MQGGFVARRVHQRGQRLGALEAWRPLSWLTRLAGSPLNAGDDNVLAGDLNDWRGQPAIRSVRGLDDIWPDLLQAGNAGSK